MSHEHGMTGAAARLDILRRYNKITGRLPAVLLYTALVDVVIRSE